MILENLEGSREGQVPARSGCPATASGMQKEHKKYTCEEGHPPPPKGYCGQGKNLADLMKPLYHNW